MLLTKSTINNGLSPFAILPGLRNISVFIDGVCRAWWGDCPPADYVEHPSTVAVLTMWHPRGLALGQWP